MTLWRLEVLRLTRTHRWIALTAVYLVFGLLGPVTARYLPQILSAAGGDLDGAVIQLPDPLPSDGMAQYVSNASQLGTLVVVILAASALCFDAISEMGVFLRTRVQPTWRILVPRIAVMATAASLAYVVGALAAWYETWALLGGLPFARTLTGIGLGVVYLVFAVALVAAVAQRLRSVLSTVIASLVILIAMPVIGLIPDVSRWLPSTLSSALAELASPHGAGNYWPALGTTVVLTAALLWLAFRWADRREL
ncbi:hypothetical protein [Demequina aurantiaca]|uniref:hypothetical protein n=1 Tax=Demequina aurantiaca TaxID=676200 RepID=UPI00078166D2|nr:hypothetical protein [Demequina aurantiaca]